jgi:hypothetical protein
MEEESNYPPRLYWHYIRRNRVKAKFFSLYRAIPAVLSFMAQFIWKHKPRTPFTEMWIAIAIIVAVYFGLFALESLWNTIVLTPPRIYAQQIDVIGELKAKNSILERELREPQVSPQEQRKREAVREMAQFSDAGREIIRFILDNGDTPLTTLRYDRFGKGIYETIQMAKNLNLVQERTSEKKTILTINPEFKAALAFVLNEKAR